jgi:hypothetical protein
VNTKQTKTEQTKFVPSAVHAMSLNRSLFTGSEASDAQSHAVCACLPSSSIPANRFSQRAS